MPDDAEWVKRLALGDEQALVAIYDRYQGRIYRFAMQMTGNSTLAQDVTQEVFLALLRRPPAFDAERGALGSFLFGMARNQVLKSLRRERHYVEWPASAGDALREPGLDAVSRVSQGQQTEAVREAVLSLPPTYREVVVLCELQGLSYAESATALDLPIGTVRSRLHRARAMLLKKLAARLKPVAGREAAR